MGGHYFNRKCLEFLQKLFGKDCFEKWKTTECGDFLDLERTIDDFKRKVSLREDDVQMKVDRPLERMYKEESRGKCTDDFVSEFTEAIQSSKDGRIVLKNAFLRNFLKEVVVAIERYLTAITDDQPSAKTIFLVGGLAKSTFVREYVESHFPQCTVIVPEDPGVAVLKGAVLLGNRPQTIAARIARYSYGIGVTEYFVEGKHRDDYKITIDGEVKCDKVFEKLIEKGQVLQYGQRFTTTTWVSAKLPETKQETFLTYLYQSTQTSPMYITDDSCSKLGGFCELPPEGGWPDVCKTKVEIIVGEAEFKLVLSDDLGSKYETKIDFLFSKE